MNFFNPLRFLKKQNIVNLTPTLVSDETFDKIAIEIDIGHIISEKALGITVKDNDGWINLNLDDIYKDERFDKILRYHIEDKEWHKNINDIEFGLVKYFNRVDILRLLNNINTAININATNQDRANTLKRYTTVSCIIYNTSIVDKMYLLDDDTLNLLAKYIILTKHVNVDIENALPGIDQKLAKYIPNLNEIIYRVVNNREFRKIYDYSKLPNAVDLYNRVKSFDDMSRLKSGKTDRLDLDIMQFKKVLSCIFLSANIMIPVDYLYIDMDVIDYCNNRHIMPNF